MKTTEHFLRTIEIFNGLTDEELQVVESTMTTRSFDAHQTLFLEGDEGDELYIVEEGEIAISVALQNGEHIVISTIKSGNFFGEMSIFEQAPRSATCYTTSASTLLILRSSDFDTLLKNHPDIATKIMYRMLNITTARLGNTGRFLSDMVQWGEEARKRAVTDPFTGLFNRRFLDDTLEEQFSRAKARGKKLSLAMVDLDHFGTLNSIYGEKVGDTIILSAVEVFKTVFDKNDILIRYGGDEFIFILPGRGTDEAYRACNEVCTQLRQLTLLKDLQGRINTITSSIGVATFPDHASTVKKLLAKTDAALYEAKEQGRNRAIIAQL
jgi:diguanylate cyclase (GGDEF)-like protein